MDGYTPTSIHTAVSWAKHFLHRHAIQNPGLEVHLLLSYVLQVPRAYLLAHSEEIVDSLQLTRFLALLQRRVLHEPYAYLVGTRDWFDFTVTVNRNVLIPRPETEQLAQLAIAATCRFAHEHSIQPVLADIGTGSGVLAIALARAFPYLSVYATESSPGAVRTAKQNTSILDVSRIQICETDLLIGLPQAQVIVANLPYIPTADILHLAPELAYEPNSALDGGSSGLEVITAFFAQAHAYIQPSSILLLECGHTQAQSVVHLARGFWPDASFSVTMDFSGVERFVSITI